MRSHFLLRDCSPLCLISHLFLPPFGKTVGVITPLSDHRWRLLPSLEDRISVGALEQGQKCFSLGSLLYSGWNILSHCAVWNMIHACPGMFLHPRKIQGGWVASSLGKGHISFLVDRSRNAAAGCCWSTTKEPNAVINAYAKALECPGLRLREDTALTSRTSLQLRPKPFSGPGVGVSLNHPSPLWPMQC